MSSFFSVCSTVFFNSSRGGGPSSQFTFNVEDVCKKHLIEDQRAEKVRQATLQVIGFDMWGKAVTVHDWLVGKIFAIGRNPRTENFELLVENNKVLQATFDRGLLLKGRDNPYEREKIASNRAVTSYAGDYDHLARFVMGEWMRKIKDEHHLDRIVLAKDFAIQASESSDAPVYERYYVASEFIPDLLPIEEAWGVILALPVEEQEELIRQMFHLVYYSGFMSAHPGNYMFKFDSENKLLAVFFDLEPYGLFVDRYERRMDESTWPYEMFPRPSVGGRMPRFLEDCAIVGIDILVKGLRAQGDPEDQTIKLVEKHYKLMDALADRAYEMQELTPIERVAPFGFCSRSICCCLCLTLEAYSLWKKHKQKVAQVAQGPAPQVMSSNV